MNPLLLVILCALVVALILFGVLAGLEWLIRTAGIGIWSLIRRERKPGAMPVIAANHAARAVGEAEDTRTRVIEQSFDKTQLIEPAEAFAQIQATLAANRQQF